MTVDANGQARVARFMFVHSSGGDSNRVSNYFSRQNLDGCKFHETIDLKITATFSLRYEVGKFI